MSTYQLYPGGAIYKVQSIASSQQNVAWQPNMLTNPLGIYYASGAVNLKTPSQHFRERSSPRAI